MFQFTFRFAMSFVIFLCMSLVPNARVFAESAITCHCFKDRTYNPENKFAADEYLLATTFNSLLSKSFDISKKQIVFLKMKDGVRHNDLLIGLKISQSMNESFESLLQRRREKHSWSQILKDLMQKKSVQIDYVLQAIQYGVSDKAASAEIADQFINNYFTAPLSKIKRFRLDGFTEKEIILIFLLSKVSGQSPESVAGMYNSNEKSWSEIANTFNIEPSAAGKIILGKVE